MTRPARYCDLFERAYFGIGIDDEFCEKPTEIQARPEPVVWHFAEPITFTEAEIMPKPGQLLGMQPGDRNAGSIFSPEYGP